MASRSRYKDRTITQPGGKPTPGIGRGGGGGYVPNKRKSSGSSAGPPPSRPKPPPGQVSIASGGPNPKGLRALGNMPKTRSNPGKPSAGSGGPRIAASNSSLGSHLRAIQPGQVKRLSGSASSPGTPSKAPSTRFGERKGSASDGGSIVRRQPGAGKIGSGKAVGLKTRKRPKASKPVKSPRSYK